MWGCSGFKMAVIPKMVFRISNVWVLGCSSLFFFQQSFKEHHFLCTHTHKSRCVCLCIWVLAISKRTLEKQVTGDTSIPVGRLARLGIEIKCTFQFDLFFFLLTTCVFKSFFWEKKTKTFWHKLYHNCESINVTTEKYLSWFPGPWESWPDLKCWRQVPNHWATQASLLFFSPWGLFIWERNGEGRCKRRGRENLK